MGLDYTRMPMNQAARPDVQVLRSVVIGLQKMWLSTMLLPRFCVLLGKKALQRFLAAKFVYHKLTKRLG